MRIFPRGRRGILRAVLVVASAYILFGHICTPVRVKGSSMEPTYHDGGFNFCLRPRYVWRAPGHGDLVMMRYAGSRAMLFKRVLGVAGDSIAFAGGRLVRNGARVDEPYVVWECDWNVPERRVEVGCVYVMGDNRSMPFEAHEGGQVSTSRIKGGPLW